MGASILIATLKNTKKSGKKSGKNIQNGFFNRVLAPRVEIAEILVKNAAEPNRQHIFKLTSPNIFHSILQWFFILPTSPVRT